MDYTIEGQTRHYSIWFGIYLGQSMAEDFRVKDRIDLEDPEAVDAMILGWAAEFAESSRDDSWDFYTEKLSAYMHGGNGGVR